VLDDLRLYFSRCLLSEPRSMFAVPRGSSMEVYAETVLFLSAGIKFGSIG